MKKILSINLFIILLFILSNNALSQNALVFQTDFGLEEPAVASMKGVAYNVSSELKMFDITHEIPKFNIWEAAYRLDQAAKYWPTGTVFVNVVDPGVGSERKSVVMKTKTGQFFVSPDNGSLSLVSETLGIDEIREIDEDINRLPGSERSHTFHGRDVYAYTGARLASNQINFEEVGPKIPTKVTSISHPEATIKNNIIESAVKNAVYGIIKFAVVKRSPLKSLEKKFIEIGNNEISKKLGSESSVLLLLSLNSLSYSGKNLLSV